MARGWANSSFHDGRYQRIEDLIKAGTHRVEIWGNANDGWWPYLVSDTKMEDGTTSTSGVQVGPCFDKLCGETMRDAREAAARCYGIATEAVRKGKNWV